MNFIEALSEAMKANREATMICPSCQRPYDKNATDRPGPECGCEQASLPMTARIDPVEVAGRVGTPGMDVYGPTEGELRALARVVEAAVEVIASVPSTYDEAHPTVKRHAAALIALDAALKGE